LGLATDKEVTGDFNRDGRSYLAVIRQTPNGLAWYVRQSGNSSLRSFLWGASSDKPVLGDYDGGWRSRCRTGCAAHQKRTGSDNFIRFGNFFFSVLTNQ